MCAVLVVRHGSPRDRTHARPVARAATLRPGQLHQGAVGEPGQLRRTVLQVPHQQHGAL